MYDNRNYGSEPQLQQDIMADEVDFQFFLEFLFYLFLLVVVVLPKIARQMVVGVASWQIPKPGMY